MDWIVTPQISYAGLLLGSMTAMLLWYGVDRLCGFVGRRRTEARLHEEGKRRLLRARDKVKAELRTNGASSSERSRKPSATDGNTHGR